MIRVSDVLAILYPDALDWVPDSALDRGTRLHEYNEHWVNTLLMGQIEPPNSNHLSDTDSLRIRAVIGWLDIQGIEFESTEEKVSHEYGFSGHPDLLCMWRHKPWCLDYKFADSLTEQNEIQGEAYRRLTGRPVALVQCTGDAKIILKKLKPRPDLWAVFLSGLNVLKFQLKHTETTHV